MNVATKLPQRASKVSVLGILQEASQKIPPKKAELSIRVGVVAGKSD